MGYLSRAFPELHERAVDAEWMKSPLAHGTPEWEMSPISEKVVFIHELANAGMDPSWFLEHAFQECEEETDIPEGDTVWNMAGRGLWKLLEEARRQGAPRFHRYRNKGCRKRPVPLTRNMLWKEIEALGGICALLEMETSSPGESYVLRRLRLLDSAKRAGWNPEELLGYGLKKLAEKYPDPSEEYWSRVAGKSMGRLFQWTFDRLARAQAA